MRLPPMVLVILLWAAGLGAAAQFGKISVLFEDLRAIYGGQGAAALGLIVSVVGMVGLVFGTTAGLLVARIGPRRALLAAMALGAAASAVQALLPPYPLMLAARVVEGLSHLAIVVVGPTMIAALAPEAQRPLAMTLWSSFFGVTYLSDIEAPELGRTRIMVHGTTLHGAQSLEPGGRCRPTAYYAAPTVIGTVFRTEQAARPAMRIGAVGSRAWINS